MNFNEDNRLEQVFRDDLSREDEDEPHQWLPLDHKCTVFKLLTSHTSDQRSF